MKTEWMQNGHEHNGTDHQKAEIRRAISSMPWQDAPKHGETISLPMMPGLGIQAAIKNYRIPKVSRFGFSNALAPYGFYGITGHYKNADVDVYVVDEGSSIVAVCADVTEK